MPKYDFRCTTCGCQFEVTRSFGAASEPARCPHDGAEATRLFSPPLELLVYGREPMVRPAQATVPPGALSCHDHGPPPRSAGDEAGQPAGHSGSHWHATGYASGEPGDHAHAQGHAHHH